MNFNTCLEEETETYVETKGAVVGKIVERHLII